MKMSIKNLKLNGFDCQGRGVLKYTLPEDVSLSVELYTLR